MGELMVRKAATIATTKVSVPNPTPIVRSAFSSATMVAPSGLLHDQVGYAAKHEDGRDGPKQNDRHHFLLWLLSRIGRKTRTSGAWFRLRCGLGLTLCTHGNAVTAPQTARALIGTRAQGLRFAFHHA